MRADQWPELGKASSEYPQGLSHGSFGRAVDGYSGYFSDNATNKIVELNGGDDDPSLPRLKVGMAVRLQKAIGPFVAGEACIIEGFELTRWVRTREQRLELEAEGRGEETPEVVVVKNQDGSQTASVRPSDLSMS